MRTPGRAARAALPTLLLAALATLAPAAESGGAEPPRTLILGLDGVAIRSVEEAREHGAFAGWQAPCNMISTFPSLTNIAFTAILQPFGADTAGGYEVQHFDIAQNKVVGGTPIGYSERLNDWRRIFDVTGRSFGSKISAYTGPAHNAWKKFAEAESLLFESEQRFVLAHLGATDALAHLRGDPAILKFLLELDRRLEATQQRHQEELGEPLRIVVLSDHGNTDLKVSYSGGYHDLLRGAGLEVVNRLEGPRDVVAPTFGLVSYGAIYSRPELAETAARAVARHEEVALAAWLAGEGEIWTVSHDGDAILRWRGDSGARRISYLPQNGDPLLLAEIRSRMDREGLLDDEGFASEDAWLVATAAAEFPDSPRRLINSLTGPWLKNLASVVFSIQPGYAWGWKSGHISSRLIGGKLEGTHGGLDRSSSMGFLITNDPGFRPLIALRAHEALVSFAPDEVSLPEAPAAGAPRGN